MNTVINPSSEYKLDSLGKKGSFRRDGSYRIFHITKKQKEESDDDDNHFYTKSERIINKEKDTKTKYQKKSFKISNRNGLDGRKRKSTKNKRLLFHPKTSAELTSNEIKTLPSSHLLTNNLSSSIISNNISSNQLLKQTNIHQSSESDALVEVIDQTINHDEETLNDLLARANQLETTVKKQEFTKIQPLSRPSMQRRRKRFIITCSIVLIAFTVIIAIVIFIVVRKLRYKTHTNQISKTSAFYDPH